jgi:AsmA protein
VGAAIAAGLLVALVAVLVARVDSAAVTRRVVDLVLPAASRALGRDVAIHDAHLSLFPDARVGLSGVTVAGRAGEPPLVDAEALDVELGLWPLLRSLGKELDVRSVTLVRPTVNLVLGRDRAWSAGALRGGDPPAPPPRPRSLDVAGGGPRVAIRQVRIEKAAVRLLDRGAKSPGVVVTDLDLVASGVGPGLPVTARLAASLGGAMQDVHAELSISALPDGIPARPEDWPEVTGSLRVGALALDRVRALLPAAVAAIVRGGKVSLDARVATVEGTYRVEGTGEVMDLRLRGQVASGHFRAAAQLAPARPRSAKLDVTELVLRGPGLDLGGHAEVQAAPLRAWFVVTGPLLDLDAVMGLLPGGDAESRPARGGGPLVPASLRRQLDAAQVRGTVAVGTLRSGRLEATDVRARVRLEGGALLLDDLEAAVFGGRVSAAGTRVALTAAEPAWTLAARLAGVEVGAATQVFSGSSPLAGRVDGRLDVSGAGTDWARIRAAVSGVAELALVEGALTTADLGEEVLRAVASGLRGARRDGAPDDVGARAGGRTELRDLAGSFAVKDGFLAARAPLRFEAPSGPVSLGGRVGLDGRLELTGTTAVRRAAIAGAAAVPLPHTIEVPLAVTGTLEHPALAVNAGAATGRSRPPRLPRRTRPRRRRAGRRGAGGRGAAPWA